MVVYAYSSRFSSLSMEGNGTIITDQAIYIHPSHEDWAPSNRIPLSDICNYLVYRENDRDMVRLLSDKRECRILGRTVAPNDTTAEELVELLRALQQSLIRGNSEDKQHYEETLNWALSYVQKGFRETGVLEGKYEEILSIIEKNPVYTTNALLLKAENAYRKCDDIFYENFLSGMEGALPRETIAVLRHPEKMFFKAFIRDIADVNADSMTRSLLNPYLNLKAKRQLTLCEAQILCMLCLRMEDMNIFDELFNMILPYLSSDEKWNIRCFAARNRRMRMSGVYEIMLTGNVPGATGLHFEDDLSLTPLHYALMIRNKELVLRLLSEREWGSGHGPLGRDKLLEIVYDYVFVASVLYEDEEFIKEVFLSTSESARALRRSLTKIQNFIEISERMKMKCKENLRERVAYQSKAFHAGSKEGFENYEKEISVLFHEIVEYDSRLEEYREMKDEMERELRDMLRGEIDDARSRASVIDEALHPFTEHIMRIFREPDALLAELADTMLDYRLYCYKEIYFLAPSYIKLKLPYYEWENGVIKERGITDFCEEGERDGVTFENPSEKARRAEEERNAREQQRQRERQRSRSAQSHNSTISDNTYHWFSEAALSDITILKHEYRLLVKKYHPDASKDSSTTDVLRAIMDERAEILEQM